MPQRRLGAGGLRHRVNLVRDSSTASDRNDDGELPEVPETVAHNIPARVRTMTSDERRFAHALEVGATHVVTVRHRTDISADRWFTWNWDGTVRRLDIAGQPVDDLNTRRFLDVPCRERV